MTFYQRQTTFLLTAFMVVSGQAQSVFDWSVAQQAPASHVQFHTPVVSPIRTVSLTGSIPLTDNRKLGRLSTQKFNDAIAAEIRQSLDSLLSVQGANLASLDVRGFGAPIGNFRRNETRSTARAVDLKTALMSTPLGTGTLSVTWITEDWDSIASLINHSHLPLSQAAADIIRSVEVADGRESQLRMLGNGSLYERLQHDIFPQVCRLEFTATVNIPQQYTHTGWLPLDNDRTPMSLSDLYAAATRFPRDSREFGDMVNVIVRLYPDNTDARINAAAVALVRGELKRAEGLLHGMDTNPRAYHNLGILYLLKGESQRAEVYLKMAQAEGVQESTLVLSELTTHPTK